MLSASWYDHLLDMAAGDEEALIGRILSHVPTRVQDFLRRHYGPRHPNFRKL
jgi:hypothetical protein